MSDLMHQNMCHDRAQRFLVFGPIVEDGAPVEKDHVGKPPRFGRSLILRHADAVEKSKQIEGLGFHGIQHIVSREILHQDHKPFR